MTHRIINELTLVAGEIAGHEAALEPLYTRRRELLAEGVQAGLTSTELADAAEVSRARVSQVSPRPKPELTDTGTPAEREPVGEKPATALRGIESVLGREVLSGRYSAHESKPYGRRVTMWADLESRQWVGEIGTSERLEGDTLAHVLSAAKWLRATRVFLCGAAPTAEGEYGEAGTRAWFLSDPGPGWAVAPTGHHLSDARTPTARYVFDDGLAVEVMRTAAWWGDSDAGPADSRGAWHALQDKIRESFGDSSRLLATPATTGRDLWQRTIGPKTNYPVLSDEIRDLIHATAGQGRIELCRPPATAYTGSAGDYSVPGVHVRDGRLMYAALTWGMPVGTPTLLTAAAVQMMPEAQLHKAIMGRSRWHIVAQVPVSWTRPFGLLMAPRDGGKGWQYPSTPGETFETWCDGAELALARSQGWGVKILGGMTWREGKPLNSWTEKLLAIWQWFEGHTFEQLCRRAIRSLILFSVGAFASQGRTSTFTLPEDQAERVPAGVSPSRAGGMLVWTQDAPATPWSMQLAHPEWSATIWARARVRMLDGPGAAPVKDGGKPRRTGALHLPAGIDVIAFRTDALVLTGDPGWPDDGKVGRLRFDGELPGTQPWPETEAEMLRLKTAAQNRTHK